MSARVRAIRTLAALCYHTRALRVLRAVAGRFRAGSAFPILVFHRVNDDGDPFFPSLPTSVFAARMEHIVRHYVVLPLDELVVRLAGGCVPSNALALTFDDGYRDTLSHAAPILARHGLPATVFLATGYIGTREMPWYDVLAGAIKTGRRDYVNLPGARALPLGSEPERLRALGAALRHLKSLADTDRRRAVARMVADLEGDDVAGQKRVMLTWDEVGALRGLGFSIGAHTVTHPIMARTTPEEAWEEIHGSKTAIERRLGVQVTGFAYPNGAPEDYDEASVHFVKQAGFAWAVTTRRGLNRSSTPMFELRRGGPWEQHLPTYALKLAHYHLTGA